MALLIPGSVSWGYEVDNLAGATPSVTPGTSFNIGGGNSDGAAVSVITLTKDIHYLALIAGGTSQGAEDNSATMDILVDPAGGTSWATFITGLVIGSSAQPSATQRLAHDYHFPITIKAGSAIGVVSRKTGATTNTGRVIMWAFGSSKRNEIKWSGQKVETLGLTTASKGTAHTAGNSGAFSAYATIGTSTRKYSAIQFGFNSVDSNTQQNAYHWQIGAGGSQLAGTPTLYTTSSTGEVGVRSGPGAILVDVQGGTALQVRGTASGTAEAADVALYGVY